MASSTDNASIEDILDDLQLNQVILQSLDQERPDAVAERQEILDIIDDLKARLAELRGDPPGGVPTQLSSGGAANDANVASQGPSQPWTSQPLPSRPIHRPSSPLFAAPSSMRKRQRSGHNDDEDQDDEEDAETDVTDDLELPVKRVRTTRPQESSSPSAQSSRSERTDDQDEGSGDGTDELRKLLGLDSQDTLKRLREEQRMAEMWLEERKEQERRDEEFARRLNEGFQEPNRQSSPASSSAHYPAAGAFPDSSPPPQRRGEQWTSYRDPGIASLNPLPTQTIDPTSRPFGSSFFPDRSRLGSDRYPVPIAQDSDDSDLAEITAGDFQRLTHSPSSQYTDGISPYSWMAHRRPDSDSFRTFPGPDGLGASGPVYGPNVFQSTLARLEQAGRSIFGAFPNTLPSHRGSEYYDMLR